MLKEPVGPVVPGSVQFKAQHRRAAETAGAFACEPAVSQQSLIPIIGHLCTPALLWTPATALPVMAAMSMKVVSHFRIIGKRLY
jgi:hypothetical protein